jgi:hypothetical protein
MISIVNIGFALLGAMVAFMTILVARGVSRLRLRVNRRIITKRGRSDYETICDVYDQLASLTDNYDNLINEYKPHKRIMDHIATARALHVAMMPISNRASRRLDSLYRGNITTGVPKPWYYKYINWIDLSLW